MPHAHITEAPEPTTNTKSAFPRHHPTSTSAHPPNAITPEALITDYLRADLTLPDLATLHDITLEQLLDTLESPGFIRLIDRLTSQAELQARRAAIAARPIAVQTLRHLSTHDPADARPLSPAIEVRHREITRKAAAQLTRLANAKNNTAGRQRAPRCQSSDKPAIPTGPCTQQPLVHAFRNASTSSVSTEPSPLKSAASSSAVHALRNASTSCVLTTSSSLKSATHHSNPSSRESRLAYRVPLKAGPAVAMLHTELPAESISTIRFSSAMQTIELPLAIRCTPDMKLEKNGTPSISSSEAVKSAGP